MSYTKDIRTKKTEKEDVPGAADAPDPAQDAALPSIRKRNKQPNENSPIVQERR